MASLNMMNRVKIHTAYGPLRNGFCHIVFLALNAAVVNGSIIEAVHLRTEHRINPVGIGNTVPRLSWMISSNDREVFQTAYQMQCTASLTEFDQGRLIWDSGSLPSGQSQLVPYGGPALESGQRIYWRVRVWDNRGRMSDWSEPACWEMGLLDPADWEAGWIEPPADERDEEIRPCPYLRNEFRIAKNIRQARVYVTSHGLYELHLNGAKVSDHLFTPGWTSYDKRLQYQVFDVSEQLRKGKNAVGAILGGGWYSGPFGWEGRRGLYGKGVSLLLQINITYADGTEEIIISDDSWKTSDGPILQSEIYDGETYDARLELEGWDEPGYNDREWRACVEKEYGYNRLVPCEGVPVRITQTLEPVRQFTTPAGELVFDMGQNMVGWVRFQLRGTRGTEILLQHAEVLDKAGNFYTENLRTAKQEIRYTFKGDGLETFEPHFTFQGFRYVKITGYKGRVSLHDLEGRVIHSDMEVAGDFTCSDSLINRLQRNISWGLRGNFLDIPTDCPQRDERMGWTGDAQVFAPTACFNMHTAAFFTKWLRDLAADQRTDGSVPWVVPMVIEGGGGTGWSDGYGAAGWADAAVTIPWTLYQSYGDVQILETQYESMKGWVEYMVAKSSDRYIFDHGFHFGDWLAFAEYYSLKYHAPDYGFAGAHTDKDLIATAYFYHSAGILQKTASLLGREEDAERYAALLPRIKKAFQKEFVSPATRLSSNTQTAYSLTLSFGLLKDEQIPLAAARLAANVEHFGHLTTGFLGTPLLCHTLSGNGYPGLAYRLLFQDQYPSWLYPVTMGATTIWERWDGIRPDSSFQDPGMNSFNHYAYGAIGDWLYRNAAGIRNAEPGYRKIIIQPLLHERLEYVSAWHQSPYGRIASSWETSSGELTMKVTIPPNTTARIYIPAAHSSAIRESGVPLEEAAGIMGIEENGDHIVVESGSGSYIFKTGL